MQPVRFYGGFLLTSPLDATPFEQEEQEPLFELSNPQDYGTTTPTPPIINNQSANTPRQAPISDSEESDNANATSTDVQSQTRRPLQQSRDGYASLPAAVPGKKESHSVSTF